MSIFCCWHLSQKSLFFHLNTVLRKRLDCQVPLEGREELLKAPADGHIVAAFGVELELHHRGPALADLDFYGG